MIKFIILLVVFTFIISAAVFVADVLKWHKQEKKVDCSPSAHEKNIDVAEVSDRSPFEEGVNDNVTND